MTYYELINDAEHKLNLNKITLGEYEEMIKPLKKEIEQQPCEDCISRADVLTLAEKGTLVSNGNYKSVCKAINDLPSVTPKAEWIPVSERLPEEFICDDGYVEPSDYVLVWGDHGNYGVSRYWGNRRSKSESPTTYKDWMDLDWVVQKPIAWMPLPQPYQAESEE